MPTDYVRSTPIRRLPRPTDHHSICNIIGSVVATIAAIAFSLPFFLIFILVLPAYLSVRWLLLSMRCNRRRPNEPGSESVRSNDSRWLGTKWRSSVIHAVLVFEAREGVNVDHFRRLLLKRVIPLYPRLTQRLIFLPLLVGLGNCWMTDAKFSIDQHVFSGPSVLKNEKDLQDYVSELITNGLPEDKSPWQLQVFQSFGINRDTIVILRVHQSVADGTALMRLLCHSLADSRILDIPERPRYGSLASCVNVFRACMVGPLTLLLWIFFSEEDCNVLTQRSTWTGSVTVTWSASITLPKIIRIKQVTRSTVNCVLLSALAGALRRLIQGCGITQPPNLKVVVPMDLQDQTSGSSGRIELGNKTSSVILPLPVAMEGCVPRLWATRKSLDSLKTSADPIILYMATVALMSIGSASFARHLINFFTDKASLQFSSFPGPTSDILLEGQALKGIYPILPPQANLGISITTITYADQVFISVLAERTLGPAAELILKYLEEQIEILWKLLQNRRVPGEKESPTLYMKAHKFKSLSKEVEVDPKLISIQKNLNECKEDEKEGKMATLRIEFSELVDEIEKRQSQDEIDNVKLQQKVLFCSNCKKQVPKPYNVKPQQKALFCFNCKKQVSKPSKSMKHQTSRSKNVQKKQVEKDFPNTSSLSKKEKAAFSERVTGNDDKYGVICTSETNVDERTMRSSITSKNWNEKLESNMQCSVDLRDHDSEKEKHWKMNKSKTKKFKEKLEKTNLNFDEESLEKIKINSQLELNVSSIAGPTQNAQIIHQRYQEIFQVVDEKQACQQQFTVDSFGKKEDRTDDGDEIEIVGGVLI